MQSPNKLINVIFDVKVVVNLTRTPPLGSFEESMRERALVVGFLEPFSPDNRTIVVVGEYFRRLLPFAIELFPNVSD